MSTQEVNSSDRKYSNFTFTIITIVNLIKRNHYSQLAGHKAIKELRSMAVAALKVTKVWPIEKYARFIADSQQSVLPQKESRKGGTWQASRI